MRLRRNECHIVSDPGSDLSGTKEVDCLSFSALMLQRTYMECRGRTSNGSCAGSPRMPFLPVQELGLQLTGSGYAQPQEYSNFLLWFRGYLGYEV